MYMNHTETRANQSQNLSEVNQSIMPAKFKPPEQTSNHIQLSSVFRNNLPELHQLNQFRHNFPDLNNLQANLHLEVREVLNNNNFDLLYVSFDNRPVPANELQALVDGRLDSQPEPDDGERSSASQSRSDRLKTKRSSLVDGCSSAFSVLRSNDDLFSDKNDLKSGGQEARGASKAVFSPALPNGKQYKPNYGLQEPLLYSGSRFVGVQKSTVGNGKTNACYGVEVIIQHCSLEDDFICGHLKINGLTDEYPTLTTFFEGEIISSRYPFLTRKYDTDCDTDRQHWSRFGPAFSPFLNSLSEENYDYSKIKNSQYIFMRWKEEFLASDHKVKKIDGACFDGFYYIMFNRLTESIEGFYFHKQAESFQLLSLKHESSDAKSNLKSNVKSNNKIYEFR